MFRQISVEKLKEVDEFDFKEIEIEFDSKEFLELEEQLNNLHIFI